MPSSICLHFRNIQTFEFLASEKPLSPLYGFIIDLWYHVSFPRDDMGVLRFECVKDLNNTWKINWCTERRID